MIQKIATLSSWIFHPLIMPVVGMYLIFNSGNYLSLMPFEGQKAVYIILFTSTFLLPLSIIPLFLFQRLIKSVEMDERRERMLPMIISFIFYLFGYYILFKIGAPKTILLYLLGAVLCLLITILISFYWKISAHMISLGGITGMLIGISHELMAEIHTWLILSILISGLIGTARLFLKSHTPGQIFSGYFLGFGILSCLFLLF